MQTIDPTLMTVLVVTCAGALMVHAGLAKRRLAWKPRWTPHERRRRS